MSTIPPLTLTPDERIRLAAQLDVIEEAGVALANDLSRMLNILAALRPVIQQARTILERERSS